MAKYMKTEQGYMDISILVPKPFKPSGKSYLTFRSLNSFTLAVYDKNKHWDGTIEYFASDKTWTVWDGTSALSAVADDGEYVLYLRGTGNTVIIGGYSRHRWVLTGIDIACVGNIENLLDYTTVESGGHPRMASSCYYYMFSGCTALTQAPALPATTLAIQCYSSMFSGCTALTQAPALPATTLADQCYRGMFQGCTALTQAPALPAITLAYYCYSSMFSGCTALTQAPALPAITLAYYCYSNMFSGCTALTQAPALPATTLADNCYHYMFSGCTALTQAPALSATTLADNCYHYMFSGCTALTQAPALPAITLASSCYYYMFKGCISLKLSTTKTDEYTQEYRIPSSGDGGTATSALRGMFDSTGGTFTGTPAINTTYYLSSDNMIVCETEVATLNGYVGSMIDFAIGEYADSAEYIIPSSTEGSTKKFKLSVDDSGTIKTTNTDDSVEVQFARTSDIPTVDSTLTQSGQAADASEVGKEIRTVSGKIPTVFDWAKKELFDKADLVDPAGINSFLTIDGVEYYRYHCGPNNFEWNNPKPYPGSVTITARAVSQYGGTNGTRLLTIYDDGTYGPTLYVIVGGESKTVTVTTDPDKTLAKITGNYDMENWALLDMSVMSCVANYNTGLPLANSNAPGGVIADPVTEEYTVPAKIGKDGKMYVPDIPVVDTTLTQSGQAADAAAVGQELSSLSGKITTETESKVATHNTGTDTHSDIRLLISGLTDRLNALADSDDTTLDQLSEVVAYIKSNRTLIEAITTNKVSVSDIIDNLTTNVSNKPLSAAQGVALKALIDAITVPDKLPNPNALTFTGAVTGSYDGSAPLEVAIPSGGGGTGENWRLINTVITTEDVSNITITQDSNGIPLSLKKVKVLSKVRGNSAGLSAWCRVTVNNLMNYLYSDIQNTFAATEGQDNYNKSRVDFSIYAGRLMVDLHLRSLNNAASKNTLYFASNTGYFESYPDVVDAITSIRIWSSSSGIGAGTEIQVYGVDA